MSAFAHTSNDNLSFTLKHQSDCLVEALVELRNQPHHGFGLVLKALYGVFPAIHDDVVFPDIPGIPDIPEVPGNPVFPEFPG
jgi:hypothetical protein